MGPSAWRSVSTPTLRSCGPFGSYRFVPTPPSATLAQPAVTGWRVFGNRVAALLMSLTSRPIWMSSVCCSGRNVSFDQGAAAECVCEQHTSTASGAIPAPSATSTLIRAHVSSSRLSASTLTQQTARCPGSSESSNRLAVSRSCVPVADWSPRAR